MEERCPYSGVCGGCSLQHINYETQIENKKNIVLQSINSSSIYVECNDIKVFSGTPYNYRNRMDFVFSQDKLGLRRKGSFSNVVDVQYCKISNENLNKLLNEVREWFQDNKSNIECFDLKRKTGDLRYAVIRTPYFSKDSCISFVLKEESTRLNEYVDMIRDFAQKSSAKNVIITYVSEKTDNSVSNNYFVVKGNEFLHEIFLGKKLFYHSQGFFQNNSVMAEKMVKYVYDILKDENGQDLIDLYGGVGTFGVCCSDLFKRILIVESYAQSVEMARKNIKENNLNNLEAIEKDASQCHKLGMKSDDLCVITDPPRSGMGRKTVERLVSINPRKIIYVSCNPKELKKDLFLMKEKYFVKSIALFDMFPQTDHIEAVIELAKKF